MYIDAIDFLLIFLCFCCFISFLITSFCIHDNNIDYEAVSGNDIEQLSNKAKSYSWRPRNYLWLSYFTHITSVFSLTLSIYFINTQYTIISVITTIIYLLSILFDYRPSYIPSNILYKYKALLTYTILSFNITILNLIIYNQESQTLPYTQQKYYNWLPFISSILTILGVFATYIAINEAVIPQLHPPPREFTCSLFAYITLSYMNPVVAIGKVKPSLENDDVPTLIDTDTAEYIYNSIHSNKTSTTPNTNTSSPHNSDQYTITSLLCKLYSIIKYDFIRQALFQLVASIVGFLPPIALYRILNYVSSSSSSSSSHFATPSTATSANSLHFATPSDVAATSTPSPTPSSSPSSYQIFDIISINTAVILLFIAPIIQCICFAQNYTRARRNAGKEYIRLYCTYINCIVYTYRMIHSIYTCMPYYTYDTILYYTCIILYLRTNIYLMHTYMYIYR